MSDETRDGAQSFNPQRLDIARRRRGLSKIGLAELIGVSPRMITAYEREDKQPSVFTLKRLADGLGFPVAFFEADDLDEIPVAGASFRALSTLTTKERNQATAAGALAMAISDWIEERFKLPEPDVPSYQGIDPETASIALRNEWGLGEKPIRQMIRTVEARGVRVFSLPHECESVDAFSFKRGRTPFLFINTRKSAEHSRMDVAHELGHLVLHWKDRLQGRLEEREAAQFASAFLMPGNSVRALSPQRHTLSQIIRTKKTWGVSAAALTYRLHELKLISDWHYRALFAQLSRRGYRRNEPQPIAPETSSAITQVFRFLREDRITASEIADDLHLTPEELRNLVFGLVLTPVDLSRISPLNYSHDQRLPSGQRTKGAGKKMGDVSHRKNDVWKKAKKIRGKDPDLYRRDPYGNEMYKPSYGKESEKGWVIDHIKPVSHGGSDHLRNLQAMNTVKNRNLGDSTRKRSRHKQ